MPWDPVAPSTNTGYTVSLAELLAVTVTFVASVAVPLVFWFPTALTPGKSMFADPLKATPPIVLAVASAVAVPAFPVHEPELPLVFPVTFPVNAPANAVEVNVPLLGL